MPTLEEKIDANYYTAPAVTVRRPREPARKGLSTAEALRRAADEREAYDAAMPAYYAACGEHVRRQVTLDVEFKRDVCEELDITSHPKRDLLWDMAWQRGHSDGHQAILNEASELVELLR